MAKVHLRRGKEKGYEVACHNRLKVNYTVANIVGYQRERFEQVLNEHGESFICKKCLAIYKREA